MTVFVTSDHHFNHENIIKFVGRPFESVLEMNAIMIENWNKTVKPNDIVWHLGDFRWKHDVGQSASGILSRLNGRISLIQGNHDPRGWGRDVWTLKVAGVHCVLFHYPIESWNNRLKGAVHIHGHTHRPQLVSARNRFNVCVEATGYKPVAVETLLALRERESPPGEAAAAQKVTLGEFDW